MARMFYFDPSSQEYGDTGWEAPGFALGGETTRDLCFTGRYVATLRASGDSVQVLDMSIRTGLQGDYLVSEFTVPDNLAVPDFGNAYNSHGMYFDGRYYIFSYNNKFGFATDWIMTLDTLSDFRVKFLAVNDLKKNRLRGMVGDGRYLYMLDKAADTVRRYTYNGEIKDVWNYSTGATAHTLTIDGRYLWIYDTNQFETTNGSFIVMDTVTGETVDRINVPVPTGWESRPGITFDGRQFYYMLQERPAVPPISDEYNPGNDT